MSDQTKTDTEERVVNAYTKILQNLREILDTSSKITKAEFDRALRKAGTSLEEASKFTQSEIDKASKAIQKDWQSLVNVANKQKTNFLESEEFQRFTNTSLGVISKVAKSVQNWASLLDEKIDDQITYHTGEVAGSGSFECKECGKTMQLKKSGRIPPCSGCKGSAFRRVFV